MADDNIVRSYRSNNAARRISAPAAPRDSTRDIGGSDPLAELVRLIGHSDPFADLERNSGHATEPRQRANAPPSDWRKTAAALARESMLAPPAADPHFDEVDSAIAAARSLRELPHDQYAPAMTCLVVGVVGAPLQTAPSSQPVATTRPPAAARPTVPPPRRNNGGPLSLEPQAQGDTASSYQPAPPPDRVATAPASGPGLAATSSTAGGGYMAQLS